MSDGTNNQSLLVKVHKINLENEKAIIYLQEQLDCGHVLSEELLRSIDFNKGNFFTLLPETAALERVCDFYCGGILPQNKVHEVTNKEGKLSSYAWVSNLTDEMSEFIHKELSNRPNKACIFEDVMRIPSDRHLELFFEIGKRYQNQIYYYLVGVQNLSKDKIKDAIHKSDALWHQLFMITKDTLEPDRRELSNDDVINLCRNIELLVVGAYDGEGFVLWESSELES